MADQPQEHHLRLIQLLQFTISFLQFLVRIYQFSRALFYFFVQLLIHLLQLCPLFPEFHVRADSGQQLVGVKRFRHIILPPAAETFHNLFFLYAGREEYYRQLIEPLHAANVAAYLEAVHPRHVHIEQYQIELCFVSIQYLHCLLSIHGISHAVSIFTQDAADDPDVFLVVVHNQNSLFLLLCCCHGSQF